MSETRRMCPNCRAFVTTRDRVCPYCEVKLGPRAVDRRDATALVGGFIPHARFVTTVILLINFGLFAATVLLSMRRGNAGALMGLDGQTLADFGAKWNTALAAGQWWRLITAGFLHGGLIHILMNSWVLFDLGAMVEEVYGWARLIVIYLAATVAGFYASAWWSPSISVGASAGLFGLIGAMIALTLRSSSPVAMAYRGLYIRWAIYGLVIGVLPGLAIDNAAHLGGLAGGFAMGYLAGTPRLVENSLPERLWRAAAYMCVGIAAIAFLNMYLWLSRG
ncbi:MAG: rhomboid family intramembrane serine protease [bacterium]